MEAINLFELKILDFIQEYFTFAFLDTPMRFFSAICDAGLIWIILGVVLICVKKTRKTGIMLGLSLIIGLILVNGIMKTAIGRIRPYEMNTAFELLIKPLSDKSFPSGHALASFESAAVLMKRDKRLGYPALALAFVISYSRIYLYVHYPSDIIAAAVLGVLIGLFSVYIINKLEIRIEKRRDKAHSPSKQ